MKIRKSHGPQSSVDDLGAIKGIAPRMKKKRQCITWKSYRVEKVLEPHQHAFNRTISATWGAKDAKSESTCAALTQNA